MDDAGLDYVEVGFDEQSLSVATFHPSHDMELMDHKDSVMSITSRVFRGVTWRQAVRYVCRSHIPTFLLDSRVAFV